MMMVILYTRGRQAFLKTDLKVNILIFEAKRAW